MANIFKNFNLLTFQATVSKIYKRFTLPAMISATAFAVMLVFVRFHDDLSQSLENILLKVFITLSLTFFFSIALSLFAESKAFSRAKSYYLQGLSFVFGGLFYFYFEENLFNNMDEETVVYIILTILSVFCLLFIAKYIKKYFCIKAEHDEFYVSAYLLVMKFLMSAIVGIVAQLLGFIALSAMFTLFEIEFLEQGNWYAYWACFALILLAPYYLLANLPKLQDNKGSFISTIVENKFYSFLINYVALPAIFIYFVILYAYTVKVLMNFSQWPQGEVSWMVILFSFFAYVIYFAAFAFRNFLKHAAIFRKILPIAVLLQTPMLFYAIGLRINQYDLTINRYLVVVFGVWLCLLSCYYIFSKNKNFYVSFYSLFIVVIVISIGPWSVYVVPEWRQLTKLETNLQTANILQNGEIVPLENYSDIDSKLSSNIYGGIEYLSRFHGYETLDKIFAEEISVIEEKDKERFEKNKTESINRLRENEAEEKYVKKEEERKYTGLSSWELIRELSELIKVKRWHSEDKDSEPRYIRFENPSRFSRSNIEVSGYDYYVTISHSLFDNNLKFENEREENEDMYSAIIYNNKAVLKLYLDDELIEEVDIQNSIFDKILSDKEEFIEPEYDTPRTFAMPASKDMTFEISGERYDYKVNLYSISVPNPKWSKSLEQDESDRQATYATADGYVLIREKETVE